MLCILLSLVIVGVIADCQWNPWDKWSACTLDCGGQQERSIWESTSASTIIDHHNNKTTMSTTSILRLRRQVLILYLY